MTRINKDFSDLSDESYSKPSAKALKSCRRWQRLCETYLPVKYEDSIWRFSRETRETEPPQGWKLHISATVPEACDLFEKLALFLISQDVQFKAPKSLDELSNINSGLQYGYVQVGKFIVVYPSTEEQAVKLARRLHELTAEFISISVPFDKQYLPDSSVFYRYGAFAPLEMTDEKGRAVSAVRNSAGAHVRDDRFQPIPEWLSDPFQNNGKSIEEDSEDVKNPLKNTYKVFRAITQRGKGGTYQALDLSVNPPRFCIVKEGRRNGEIDWNGQDGYFLVKNEFDVLNALRKIYKDAPQVFSSFELSGNFYLVMEYVEGKSLHNLLKLRRHRLSIKQVVKFAIEIAKIIEEINKAGWVWNDCKPANLIVTRGKSLKPVDFESSYPINQSDPFDWKTKVFSKSANGLSSTKPDGKSNDLYAFAAVVYFLLTGKFYDADAPLKIAKLRRNVPEKLVEITETILSGFVPDIVNVRKELKKILDGL
jgi:tRNA A-37 threonylcarbamoyl transferase component Bud32